MHREALTSSVAHACWFRRVEQFVHVAA
jgi:hypothetical protein